MALYETTASKADAQIKNLLPPEEHIYRPWQLIGYKMESRTLKTTLDEIEILLDKQAFVRPGYEVSEGRVHVPNIFAKINGKTGIKLQNIPKLRENKLVYASVKDFYTASHSYFSEKDAEKILNSEGLIDKELLYNSRLYRYGYIRKEYQELLVDSINQIILSENLIFKANSVTGNKCAIIFALLNLDERIISLYNNFDFQDNPPCIIIKHEDKENFSESSVYTLALLNKLGFDIVIISEHGYSDVENIFREGTFNVYHCASDVNDTVNIKTGTPFIVLLFNKKKVPLIIALGLFILATSFLVTWTLFIMPVDVNAGIRPTNATNSEETYPAAAYGLDKVVIIEAKPDTDIVVEGLLTEFIIEVEYELVTLGEAKLAVCFNDGNDSQSDMQRLVVDVKKGTGRKIIKVAALPKRWEDGTPFRASCQLFTDRGTLCDSYKTSLRFTPRIADNEQNYISIIEVDPNHDLIPGEIQNFKVKVSYNLVSNDIAKLDVCFNDSDNPSYDNIKCMVDVKKGSEVLEFNIPVIPIRHPKGGMEFKVSCHLFSADKRIIDDRVSDNYILSFDN